MTFRSHHRRSAATTQRIDVARELLLTPLGWTRPPPVRWRKSVPTRWTMPSVTSVHARSEGWSLEEGWRETGSFSIDRGVGVRAP